MEAAVIEVAGSADEVPHRGSWGDPPTPQSEGYWGVSMGGGVPIWPLGGLGPPAAPRSPLGGGRHGVDPREPLPGPRPCEERREGSCTE